MSSPADHALLSASSAHRWLNCTPSARLEEQLPDNENESAKKGQIAHKIAELKLRNKFIEPMTKRRYNAALKKLQNEQYYADEFLGYTDEYLDYISGIVHSFNGNPHIAVEKKVKYEHVAPKGFGTCDCVVICQGVLHIVDFKSGSKRVDAEFNPQLRLYALGALAEYSLAYLVNTVKMAIVQPRINNISEFEETVESLTEWGKQIHSTAVEAFNGEGDCTPGTHCAFCKAKVRCRAKSESITSLENYEFRKPPFLTNDEVGVVLKKAIDIKSWVDILKEYALSELLKGEIIPGWKAVEGSGKRQFIDSDNAFDTLTTSGYDESLLYERSPLPLTKIEKLLGKKRFNELLSEHITKTEGSPTLATEDDKRQAITVKRSATEDFKDEPLPFQ